MEEQKFFRPEGSDPDGLLLFEDSILLIRNRAGGDSHFNIWSIRQKKNLGPLLLPGREKNQSLGFMSYGIYKNKLWVNDIMKNDILHLNIDDVRQEKESSAYPVPTTYYWMQMQNDSIVAMSGDYDSNYKVSLFNIYSGKVINQLIPYSSGNGTTIPREQKSAYESSLFMKPSGEKCVQACRYADQIEIMDLNYQLSKIVKGPEGFEPDVMVVTDITGKEVSTRNDDTRFAFVRGKTTNEYIYLLYSGHNHMSEHRDLGSYLYIYDWEGKPVKKLKFTSDVTDFAVTNDNKTIYAYHPDSRFIMKSTVVTAVSGAGREN
ncbi:MAG: BF3164 family lipoprotein [Chitinophagaceae bacterium]